MARQYAITSSLIRWLPLLALPALPLPAPGASGLDDSPKMRLLPACAALIAAAQTNHIPLGQFDPLSATSVLHPGDSVTFLGTFVHKQSRAQWLLYVEVATPDSRRTAEKKSAPMTVNLFGTPIEFESRPVPAKLQMLGPFAAGGSEPLKAKERTAEFTLNERFLSLGLESAAEVMRRWSEAGTNAPAAVGTNGVRHSGAKAPLAEQRAVAGSVPALTSYFEIVEHVDGLEAILWKLIKWPSVWSMVKDGGFEAGIGIGDDDSPPQPASPKDWNLPPSTPVFYFPCLLVLNGEPSVKITLVVTTPRAPLLTCGGIIGLLAEKVGDDQTYMSLRVVGAKCARQ
jgi:hypothetical protein